MSESFATPSPGEQQAPHPTRGIIFCPRCASPQTQIKNRAKKLGGAFGTCFGIASSFSGAAKGAAAVLGALAGGAMGCATGAALGQVIDDTVLNNHLCLRCGHSFPTL